MKKAVFKIQYFVASLLMSAVVVQNTNAGVPAPQMQVVQPTPIPGVVPTPPTGPAPIATAAPNAAATLKASTGQPSLEPTVADLPSTYTFRSSCITKSYKDAVYGDLIEPTLVKNADGTYTLHASCRNGVGIPTIDSRLNLTLVVRNINNNGINVRTISVRSKVGDKLRNCADISNVNGNLVCTPPNPKKK